MKKSLVSLLIPVRNDEKYLTDTLKSMRRQSFKRIEIVAIDDRSSDSSWKILQNFKKKDKRIRIYRNVKSYGTIMTLNRLVKKAKGDYVGFPSARDILHRDRIKKQVSYLLKNNNVVVLGTQCIFINKKNRKIEESSFPHQNKDIYDNSPLHGLSMQFETVLINKNLLPKDIIKFEGNFKPFMYTNFLVKLLPYGKFENLDDFLHRHRKHPQVYLEDLKKHAFSFVKFWIIGSPEYSFRTSLRILFSSIITPLRTD